MLSKADKDALAAQIQQFADERAAFSAATSGDVGAFTWATFLAWRTAVALELQAEALWEANGGEDESEEPKKPWEE